MKKILIYQDTIQQIVFKKEKNSICFYEHRMWDVNQAKWKCKQEWLADDISFTSWYFKKHVPKLLTKVGSLQEEKKRELVV